MSDKDPSSEDRGREMLDVVRECMLDYMVDKEWPDNHRVEQVQYVAASGRVLDATIELCEPEDLPAALLLTMADGNKYRMTISATLGGDT